MRVFGYDIRRPLWSIQRLRNRRIPAPAPLELSDGARFFVATASGAALPPQSRLRRALPGRSEGQMPGFEALMDDTGLFYDAFWHAGEIVLVGPPLMNFKAFVAKARVSVDAVPVRRRPRLQNRSHMQLWRLAMPHPAGDVTLDIPDIGTVQLSLQPARQEVFRGRKVLFTLSKDNDLAWIEDWVDFHVKAHGVDAVLIYDNDSGAYGAAELLDRIRAVNGVHAAVVVRWPYKYGYHGPGFDGNYCQFVAIEDARRRFLAAAAALLQIDIDEIVVSNSGTSLFDELAESPLGAVLLDGDWIEAVLPAGSPPARRHRDFRYAGPPVRKTKWAAIPHKIPDGAQMKVHDFEHGFNPPVSKDQRYRHFRAINTSWKYPRAEALPFDPAVHRLDEKWVREMTRIGWIAEPPDHSN
jgi:hypothetical protein